MPNIKTNTGIIWDYEVKGEGKDVFFIHGWGVDMRIWNQQAKYFSRNYRVIRVSLPGHGETTFKEATLECMAEDIFSILKSLNAVPVTVIGSSLGGLVALKLHSIAPDLFEKIVFVGALPKFTASEDFPFGLDVARIRKLNGQLAGNYPSIINIFFRSLFTDKERQSRRFHWLQRFRRDIALPQMEALSKYLAILETEDLRDELKKIVVPVQFINGREDTICSPKALEYLKGFLPSASYVYFDDCGHFPFLSKPYEFNEVLEKFIKSGKDGDGSRSE
ncbi:MAG: alpha/beta fold hydrolase [Candidatus Omnitrophica bacterium]|nr:alpha/beta fold hydrolase [Candidatus Omnitrophota bacterium]